MIYSCNKTSLINTINKYEINIIANSFEILFRKSFHLRCFTIGLDEKLHNTCKKLTCNLYLLFIIYY